MKKYKIVIDPGHGGSDRANRGIGGYIEADGNLLFAGLLRRFLSDDFDVVLTREKDVTLSLPTRGRMAKGADMFISVHSDAGSTTASGVTVFDSVDLKNEDIAKRVGQACADAMGIKFRGTKEKESTNYPGEDYYTVIDTAQDIGCPCVLLIERGFHSNPTEEKLLLNDRVVRDSAIAVANEIKKYFSRGGTEVGSVFKDVPDDRWSAADIKRAKELGLIGGADDKGNFNPTGSLTREQAAVIMVRLYDKVKGEK